MRLALMTWEKGERMNLGGAESRGNGAASGLSFYLDEEIIRRGDARLHGGNFVEALPYAEELIRRHPDGQAGWQMKAYALFQSNPAGALEAITEALENAADVRSCGIFLADRAEFLYQLGNYKEAEACLRVWWEEVQRGECDKQDEKMMLYALTLRRLERYEEGVRLLSGYSPSDEEWRKVLADLRDELEGRTSLEDSKYL